MTTSKKLALALVLLLTTASLGAAPSACGKRPDLDPDKPDLFKDAPPLPQKIASMDRGVVLAVPEDWTVVENAENPVIFALAPGSGANGPLANLVIETLSHRMNSYDYMEANTLTMKSTIPGLEVKWGGVDNVNGVSCAWLQYSFSRGGVKVEALSYCQTRDYRAFVVTALAPAEEYQNHEALFRAIGRSLRVLR